MEWLINRRRMMFNKAVPPVYLAFEDSRVWEICCYEWGDTEIVQGVIDSGTITCNGTGLVYSSSSFCACTAITSHKSSKNKTISASAAAQSFSMTVGITDSSAFSTLADDDIVITVVQHTNAVATKTTLASITKAQWVSDSVDGQLTIPVTTTTACKYIQVGVLAENDVRVNWTLSAVTGNRQPVGITAKQCAAVSSFRTVFYNNTLIKKFDTDSLYFTHVATIGAYAFTNTSRNLYIRIPYATTIGGGDAANYAVFMNNYATVVRIDAATRVRSVFNTLNAHTMVITTPTVPTATCRYIYAIIYVLDELVDSYKAATNWKDRTIRPISQLPTYMPSCPWIEEFKEKGLIPTSE